LATRRTAKLRLTRRFYYFCGAIGALILLIIIIVAATGGSSNSVSGRNLSMGELQRLKVAEAGSIMVLQYQKLGEEGTGSRTPEAFRAELDTLYAEGYRAISLTDLVTNHIDVPAGTTPVVLTFDDSDNSQFRFVDGTKVDPRCAMGIMEQFARDHPDFGMTATFFVLPHPFGEDDFAQQKLEYLTQRGYDIGNHTTSHTALNKLADDQVAKEIVENLRMVQQYLPGYEQKALALVGESEPKNTSLLSTGTWDGTTYNFVGAVLPGYVPSPAPCVSGFTPMRMPRVHSLARSLDQENLGSEAWLEYFRTNPERRYRSDGDPDTITLPQFMSSRIMQDQLAGKRLRTY
jgi:hypothetical protein